MEGQFENGVEEGLQIFIFLQVEMILDLEKFHDGFNALERKTKQKCFNFMFVK